MAHSTTVPSLTSHKSFRIIIHVSCIMNYIISLLIFTYGWMGGKEKRWRREWVTHNDRYNINSNIIYLYAIAVGDKSNRLWATSCKVSPSSVSFTTVISSSHSKLITTLEAIRLIRNNIIHVIRCVAIKILLLNFFLSTSSSYNNYHNSHVTVLS